MQLHRQSQPTLACSSRHVKPPPPCPSRHVKVPEAAVALAVAHTTSHHQQATPDAGDEHGSLAIFAMHDINPKTLWYRMTWLHSGCAAAHACAGCSGRGDLGAGGGRGAHACADAAAGGRGGGAGTGGGRLDCKGTAGHRAGPGAGGGARGGGRPWGHTGMEIMSMCRTAMGLRFLET